MLSILTKIYIPKLIKSFLRKKTNGFKLNMLDPIEAAVSKCKDHLNLNTIRGNMSK